MIKKLRKKNRIVSKMCMCKKIQELIIAFLKTLMIKLNIKSNMSLKLYMKKTTKKKKKKDIEIKMMMVNIMSLMKMMMIFMMLLVFKN